MSIHSARMPHVHFILQPPSRPFTLPLPVRGSSIPRIFCCVRVVLVSRSPSPSTQVLFPSYLPINVVMAATPLGHLPRSGPLGQHRSHVLHVFASLRLPHVHILFYLHLVVHLAAPCLVFPYVLDLRSPHSSVIGRQHSCLSTLIWSSSVGPEPCGFMLPLHPTMIPPFSTSPPLAD